MNNNGINSCLMLAAELYTPVDLRCFFEPDDLQGVGVELDSHITLIYAQGKVLPRKRLIGDVQNILGDQWLPFVDFIQEPENYWPVFDVCELGFFENDHDYLILKLKSDSQIYEWCKAINDGLRKKYGVNSDFDTYTPHITLAELKAGMVNKYLSLHALENVLRDSRIQFEDIFASFGITGEVNDRKQFWLTQYKNVDRFFRLEHLKKEPID